MRRGNSGCFEQSGFVDSRPPRIARLGPTWNDKSSFLRAMAGALHNSEECAPWTDSFAVLMGHDSR
jgi:hypothetical protein